MHTTTEFIHMSLKHHCIIRALRFCDSRQVDTKFTYTSSCNYRNDVYFQAIVVQPHPPYTQCTTSQKAVFPPTGALMKSIHLQVTINYWFMLVCVVRCIIFSHTTHCLWSIPWSFLSWLCTLITDGVGQILSPGNLTYLDHCPLLLYWAIHGHGLCHGLFVESGQHDGEREAGSQPHLPKRSDAWLAVADVVEQKQATPLGCLPKFVSTTLKSCSIKH